MGSDSVARMPAAAAPEHPHRITVSTSATTIQNGIYLRMLQGPNRSVHPSADGTVHTALRHDAPEATSVHTLGHSALEQHEPLLKTGEPV